MGLKAEATPNQGLRDVSGLDVRGLQSPSPHWHLAGHGGFCSATGTQIRVVLWTFFHSALRRGEGPRV